MLAAQIILKMKFFEWKIEIDFILLQLNGKEIPAEAYFQWQAHHRNVIDIYEVIYVDEYFVYVMERPENCKDLFRIIDDRSRVNSMLTEKEARKYFIQILRANICCEENGILHRDVKPENILIDMSCDEAKLIDFGLSSEVQEQPFTWFRGEKEDFFKMHSCSTNNKRS